MAQSPEALLENDEVGTGQICHGLKIALERFLLDRMEYDMHLAAKHSKIQPLANNTCVPNPFGQNKNYI